eukprot:1162016-Pelagomonas_calceolata.AAC.23
MITSVGYRASQKKQVRAATSTMLVPTHLSHVWIVSHASQERQLPAHEAAIPGKAGSMANSKHGKQHAWQLAVGSTLLEEGSIQPSLTINYPTAHDLQALKLRQAKTFASAC